MTFCSMCGAEYPDNCPDNWVICEECRIELKSGSGKSHPGALTYAPTVEEAEILFEPFELFESENDPEEDLKIVGDVGDVGDVFYMDWQAIYPVHGDVFGSAIVTLLKSAEIPAKVDRLYGGEIFWRLELGSQGFDRYVFVPKPEAQKGYELIKEYLESLESLDDET